MNRWLRLTRFDRPIGILLLLWPTSWALVVAGDGYPSFRNCCIFLAGVVLMRAAGCVINDYADRDIDPHVERTRLRPIAAGEIRPGQALLLFFGLLLLAFGLVLLTNILTIKLAFAGAALAIVYPFCKRFIHVPQVVLGIAFGWSIPMVFAAETGAVPAIAWWLFAVNVVWSVIYDTEYAMADRADDLLVGVKSTAILFDRYDRFIIGLLQLLMLGLLGKVCVELNDMQLSNWPLWTLLALTAGLFIQQQWLIRDRNPQACFNAFLQNNRVGLVIFAGLLIAHLEMTMVW